MTAQDNVQTLDIDPRLSTLYDRICDAIDEVNNANPMYFASVIGVLDMVKTNMLLQALGIDEEEERYD